MTQKGLSSYYFIKTKFIILNEEISWYRTEMFGFIQQIIDLIKLSRVKFEKIAWKMQTDEEEI